MDFNPLKVFPSNNNFDILSCNDSNTHDDIIKANRDNLEPIEQHFKNTTTPKPKKTPPPIYLHARIDEFPKVIEKLRSQYDNKFFVKYFGEKVKIKFDIMDHYLKFKEYCVNSKIQFHIFSTDQDKILAVVLGGFPKVNKDDLLQELRDHNLCALSCNEIQKNLNSLYPLYKLTFNSDITIQHLKHIPALFQIRVYWEKYNNFTLT